LKGILEFVGAAVLLYAALYYGLLLTGRMIGNLIKRQVLRDEDSDGEVHGRWTRGENHGAGGEISAPSICRPLSVLPVSSHLRLE
jgi:hypothetical protein